MAGRMLSIGRNSWDRGRSRRSEVGFSSIQDQVGGEGQKERRLRNV